MRHGDAVVWLIDFSCDFAVAQEIGVWKELQKLNVAGLKLDVMVGTTNHVLNSHMAIDVRRVG